MAAPRLPWTDNDAGDPAVPPCAPGAADTLAEGWAGGKVGPFGSEVFALAPSARLLRLDLPAPAVAELRAGDAVASIAKNSREPSVTLDVPQGKQPVVEVRAAAGQAFTLRALDATTQRIWSRTGTWWVSAATTGMGGDEVPPAVLLRRTEGQDKPPRIVASTVPTISAGAPWHARFNLRGPTDLLFQSPSGGEMAFSSTGVDIRHGRTERASMPPGYVLLTLEPKPGAIGSLDAIVGTPGTTPPPVATPLPPDPVIPLGVQTLTTGQALVLDSGNATGATVGLLVRAAPVALVEGPVVATIPAGGTLAVPVLVAPGGVLSVTELGVGPVAAGQTDNTQPGRLTVVIPVADHARTVALAWRRTPSAFPAIPAPTPPGQVAAVTAGTPSFLDLARGEERGFALTVPEGGLFRVETLGRLHTTGRLATPFIPQLASADGNGAGQNFLMQSTLRAGRYRVDVRAVDSAGHLGLLASPAPLLAGSTLVPGGSVRASLPGGSGVTFPVDIAGPPDGKYHFDVLSLGAPWTGRLEDAEGWPVVKPGALDGTESVLRPGHYRLVVTPDVVGRQVVARLRAVTKPAEITGHGPHALPFEQPQMATWREPDARDQPRTPDVWTFSLAGAAEVTITLGDGMAGELRRAGSDAVNRVVGNWTGTLEAGSYQLAATSLGRNDRLGYQVGVSSPALQPGEPRSVSLPSSLKFSVADARVVSLTSWGTIPVKAVLRRDEGAVVARANSRADDWNIAVSRLLPAGRYVLELQSASPPSVSGSAGQSGGSDDSDDAPPDDEGAAQTTATQGTAQAAKTDASVADTSSDSANTNSDDSAAPTVDVRLTLPAPLPMASAPTETAVLPGNGVHVLALATPEPGSLVLATSQSTAPSVLALERADGASWRTVALAEGHSPVVAAPADGSAAAWRIEAWTTDGGPEPIRLAARSVAAPAQSGAVTLAAVPGLPVDLAVAQAALPDAGVVAIQTSAAGMLAGGWPGHALTRASVNLVTQGKALWLLATAPGTATVQPLAFGAETVVQLPAGLAANLPAQTDAKGHLAIWRVSSGSGQPNLGVAGGVAEGSAVALADGPVTVTGGNEAIRLRVTRDAPSLLPEKAAGASSQVTLAPGTALPLTLAPGDKTMALALAPGVAAFADWHRVPVAVWTGANPVSRTVDGAWTDLLLVNTGTVSAPASVTVQPAPPAVPLRPGMMMKRFFGAGGSLSVAFDAPTGTRLVLAGDATAVAVTDATITSGTQAGVSGPGRATIQHGTGPMAVWLDAPGTSAWPDAPVQTVSLPARTALTGPALALTFDAATPALLHVSTTAPVFAALQQAGRIDPPALFAAGAELHLAVAPGPVTLRLYSADDGPLAGSVSVWAETLTPLGEGLGEIVAVAPGGSAAFSFSLANAGLVGVGLRAVPDRVSGRLLDAKGALVGEGVAQLRKLEPGSYVLEARVPPDASATVLRPALVGVTPRGNGPPPDVVQSYLELVGMKPEKAQ